LAAGPNTVGFGCQGRPKKLPKGTTNVGSCCPAEPNSVGPDSTLQKGAGSSWASGPSILGSSCAATPIDIIFCIINIINFIIINIKILLFVL
jgi:hypothetical protein